MKTSIKSPMKTLLAAALVAGLSLSAGSVLAESQYGYSSTGGAVTAQAKVTLKVTVPNLILLRVGSANTVVDELAWTVGASIPAGAVIPPTTANDVNVDWDGTAPTLTNSASPAALTASAWTNGTTATINCSMGTWVGTGGPTNADFTVASAGTLAHPGANLGACASTSFTSNAVQTSTWTYSLGGTSSSWKAGVYTNTVTYTASAV